MSTAAQRKAWNEAMRSAGAVLPASATVSGGAAASSRHGSIASRSRRKRRENARKSNNLGSGADGGISSLEEKEYRVALHMDMLEGVTDKTAGLDGDDDDDSDHDDTGKRGKKKKGGKRKRKSAPSAASKKKKNKKATPSIPKYLKARSLTSILMEEASRPDSVAKQYVNASVKRLGSGKTSTKRMKDDNDNTTTTTITYTNPYPARKFCPVTGLYGEYTEPKTGIPYASLSALEQIRERPPPWMNNNSASSASYWEAVKSLQQQV